jgi:site-specific recombinase XerD
MQNQYFISIFLDCRRAKANSKYPVKLRIFTPNPRKQKLYATKFEFTEKEFQSIWTTAKPRTEHKEIRNEIRAVELKAEEVAKSILPFSLSSFEKKYLRNKGDGSNIIYQYNEAVKKLKSNNSLSTASNYELALKSFIEFLKTKKGKAHTNLTFADVTPDWLQKYENFMINDLKRSRTTVSMYVRTLRTIFNNAIKENDVEPEMYPFGKGKYQPPTVRNVKKAFSKDNLKQLFEVEAQTPEQQKAKDFWFFSYACNGMNVKDIALLKRESIQGDKIIFYRAKTINTAKTDLKPVTVYLTDFSKAVIKNYANTNSNTDKKEYLFSILTTNDTETVKHKKIKNFTRFINQNLKKLAVNNGLTDEISTYWARHSFATSAIRSGASMEFVMEALSHNNLKTTQNYFAGFEETDKRELMEKLMNF